jgi:hypothetical protein
VTDLTTPIQADQGLASVPDLSLNFDSILGWLSTLAGAVLCISESLTRQHLRVGLDGLIAALPIGWYIGMALTLLGVCMAWRTGTTQFAVAVLVVAMCFTLTSGIVYDEPRYIWTAKHVGVVDYIRLHGSVNPSIDIYQAWPGLFAGIAWFCDVAGIGDPMRVARWWPVFADTVGVVLIRLIAGRFIKDARRCWLAGLLFFLGNTVGQDYFSPQSAAFLLSLLILTVSIRTDLLATRQIRWIIWIAAVAAVAVTHQITPYLLSLTLLVLVIFGYLRPRVVFLVPAVFGGIWASIHYSVWRKYFLGDQFGNVAGNIRLAQINGAYPKSSLILICGICLAGGVTLVGIAALGSAFRTGERFKLVRWKVALLGCAACPFLLIVSTAYYGEGINRVILFSLPWLSILASSLTRPRWTRGILSLALIPVLATTYLVAVTGVDAGNSYNSSEVRADRAFELSAKRGSSLFILGDNFPVKSTGRYNLFRFYDLTPRFSPSVSPERAVALYASAMKTLVKSPNYYAAYGPTTKGYGELNGLDTGPMITGFEDAMTHSPYWRLIFRSSGTSLYEVVGDPPGLK